LIEFLRLKRPLVSVIQSATHRQWTRATAALRLLDEDPMAYCEDFGFEPTSTGCDRFLREETRVQHEYRRDTIDRFPLVSAQQDPIGVGGIAAGFLTTAPGALAVLAVAAGYTGGDWSRRTMAWLVARDPRRMGMVLRRFIVTWGIGVLLFAAIWLALAALIPLFGALYELPPPSSEMPLGSFALEQGMRAVVVFGVYAAIGTAASFVTRSALTAFLVGAFVIVVSIGSSSVMPWYRFSLGYLVGGWMGFTRANLLVDHVWVDAFPGPIPGEIAIVIGLLGTAVVALGVAGLVVRRASVPV
jgi:hypothetical protein